MELKYPLVFTYTSYSIELHYLIVNSAVTNIFCSGLLLNQSFLHNLYLPAFLNSSANMNGIPYGCEFFDLGLTTPRYSSHPRFSRKGTICHLPFTNRSIINLLAKYNISSVLFIITHCTIFLSSVRSSTFGNSCISILSGLL